MVTIATLSSAQASAHRDDVLSVWTEVFGPVEDPEAWTDSPWDRHRSRPGYRLALAHDGARLMGFAWGYTGERGQFWSDFITRELGPKVEGWVGGHFEFVELAVIREARGRGIGGRLHDALLADLDHHCALLATSSNTQDPAVQLYSSRGWQSLARYGDDRQVMGLVLKEPSTS
ncbi:GNAT family N-acetyltransferase [Microbacterium paraoxydans]|uniref:GNAT family N-acetyltransferase n=1 Tax=Microbacterium paraoxydans TaxID=199592 RepID=UPI00352F6BBB